MLGKILDVVNAGSFGLIIVDTGQQIVEQAIEWRCLADIVAGLDLSDASDLVGRAIELGDDGMAVGFPD